MPKTIYVSLVFNFSSLISNCSFIFFFLLFGFHNFACNFSRKLWQWGLSFDSFHASSFRFLLMAIYNFFFYCFSFIYLLKMSLKVSHNIYLEFLFKYACWVPKTGALSYKLPTGSKKKIRALSVIEF